MQGYIEKFESKQILGSENKNINFKVGDLVEVHNRIIERSLKGEVKERIQIFKGTIIAFKKGGFRSTITVRKVSYGVGVEKTFPIYSPVVVKIEKKTIGRVRRAKLFYLRDLSGKKARLSSELVS